MTTRNARRGVRALIVFGLVFAIGCGRDLTEPMPGQPEFVLLAPGTVAQVSAGAGHTCALRTDGTVVCWAGTLFGAVRPRLRAGSPS
jgi:alpha-tubulin suppressor-like RCC1 family protein